MKLEIKHQERYSRGQLLLRSFFGFLYILIPHGFLLFFVNIASALVSFLAFWIVLFSGKYPEPFFHFNERVIRWSLRVSARMLHLADGYPAFGLNAEDEHIEFSIPYPEKLSRGLLILRILFGFFYVLIPHGFILYFRMLVTMIFVLINWFIVLFTGKYPESMHQFNVGTLRWQQRVSIYMLFMTDKYPPFSGKRANEL